MDKYIIIAGRDEQDEVSLAKLNSLGRYDKIARVFEPKDGDILLVDLYKVINYKTDRLIGNPYKFRKGDFVKVEIPTQELTDIYIIFQDPTINNNKYIGYMAYLIKSDYDNQNFGLITSFSINYLETNGKIWDGR